MQDKCNNRHDASREQLFSFHTDAKASRQMKHIFRLLTKSDLTKDILEKELFILWPDNAQWYAAEIIKVSPVHSPNHLASNATLVLQTQLQWQNWG